MRNASRILYFSFAFILLGAITFSSYAAHYPVITKFTNGTSIPFTTAEVDSITFSKFDTDSIEHRYFVSQVVWSGGNPYVLPIEDIEEVSFEAPETILKSNVREIKDALRASVTDFTESNDGLCLCFSTALPQVEYPIKGEYLYTLIPDSLFPLGFMGKVEEVSITEGGIYAFCSPAEFTDIFESYFGSFKGLSVIEDEENQSEKPKVKSKLNETLQGNFTLPVFKYNMSPDELVDPLEDNVSFDNSNELYISLSPKLDVNTNILIESGARISISSVIIADFELREQIGLKGKASFKKNFNVFSLGSAIPVAPAASVFLDGGFVVELSGEVGIEASMVQKFRTVGRICLSNYDKDAGSALPTFVPISNEIDVVGYGSVTGKIGAYIDVDFSIGCFKKFKIANVTAGIERGFKIDLTVPISVSELANSMSNTTLYETLSRPDGFVIKEYKDFVLQAKLMQWEMEYTKSLINDADGIILSKPLIPQFSDLQVVELSESALNLSVTESDALLKPDAGFCIINVDNGNWEEFSLGTRNNNMLSGMLFKDSKAHDHRLHPYLTLFGRQILAEPHKDLEYEEPEEPGGEEPGNPENPENPGKPNGTISDITFYLMNEPTFSTRGIRLSQVRLHGEFVVSLSDLERPSPDHYLELDVYSSGSSSKIIQLDEYINSEGNASVPVDIIISTSNVNNSGGLVTAETTIYVSVRKYSTTKRSSFQEWAVYEKEIKVTSAPNHTISDVHIVTCPDDDPLGDASMTITLNGIVGWFLYGFDFYEILDLEKKYYDSLPIAYVSSRANHDLEIYDYGMEWPYTILYDIKYPNGDYAYSIEKLAHYKLYSHLLFKFPLSDKQFPEVYGYEFHIRNVIVEKYMNGNYSLTYPVQEIYDRQIVKLSPNDWWK